MLCHTNINRYEKKKDRKKQQQQLSDKQRAPVTTERNDAGQLDRQREARVKRKRGALREAAKNDFRRLWEDEEDEEEEEKKSFRLWF